MLHRDKETRTSFISSFILKRSMGKVHFQGQITIYGRSIREPHEHPGWKRDGDLAACLAYDPGTWQLNCWTLHGVSLSYPVNRAVGLHA